MSDDFGCVVPMEDALCTDVVRNVLHDAAYKMWALAVVGVIMVNHLTLWQNGVRAFPG